MRLRFSRRLRAAGKSTVKAVLGKPRPHEHSGVVLLLALLLMSAVTGSTIAISVIINRTLQQSRNLDNFIIGSLASDTVLERGLAVVKQARRGGYALTSAVSATGVATAVSLSGSGAQFTMTGVQTADQITWPDLDQSASLDFDFLRDQPPPLGANPANALRVTGTCAGSGSPCPSLLDISWVVVDTDGTAAWSGRKILSQFEYDSTLTSYPGYLGTPIIDLNLVRSETSDVESVPTLFTGNNILAYRIRIKAVQGAVSNLAVTACQIASCSPAQPIYGRIILTGTGRAGASSTQAQSRKTASVLWQLPASPLLQYVLFSEESLIP